MHSTNMLAHKLPHAGSQASMLAHKLPHWLTSFPMLAHKLPHWLTSFPIGSQASPLAHKLPHWLTSFPMLAHKLPPKAKHIYLPSLKLTVRTCQVAPSQKETIGFQSSIIRCKLAGFVSGRVFTGAKKMQQKLFLPGDSLCPLWDGG